MLKLLTRRIEGKTDALELIGEDQFGFRRGKGTRDATGISRTLGERHIQHGIDLYICFINYEKIFDREKWTGLEG